MDFPIFFPWIGDDDQSQDLHIEALSVDDQDLAAFEAQLLHQTCGAKTMLPQ